MVGAKVFGDMTGQRFGRWRREAIKALGNAWVPEVAYEIFRIIQMVEDGHDYD